MGDWSRHFEQAYHVTVPRDLQRWLDDGLWQKPIGAEFCRPLHPEKILSPTHAEIWAGFMPPDVLPLIGNDYGDWLCVRFGRDRQVSEAIRWSHVGGDWIPFGNSLSEALLFDAALSVIMDRRPEFVDPELPEQQRYGAAQWAAQWAAQRLAQAQPIPFWTSEARCEWEGRSTELLQSLVDANLCVAAASAELALSALGNPLKALGTPSLARDLKQTWNPDFIHWMLDGAGLPAAIADKLSGQIGLSRDELTQQDWAAAERHAVRVLDLRSDLGWAGDIAGWAAERDGRYELATARYLRGMRASVFTDDSVRFRTQWYPERFAKFSVFRLDAMTKRDGSHVLGDPYFQLSRNCDPNTLRSEIAAYWFERADEAERKGDPGAAYEALVAAGWDVGLDEFTAYRPLLERLQDAAERAGWPSLAAVAAAHLGAF